MYVSLAIAALQRCLTESPNLPAHTKSLYLLLINLTRSPCSKPAPDKNASKPFVTPHDAINPMLSAAPCSQQPLSCQLNLSSHLPGFPASFACADCDAFSELYFIFDLRKGAWAVVREVYARQGAGTEVIRATRCRNKPQYTLNLRTVQEFFHTSIILLLIPFRIAGHVLRFLLRSAAAEHLLKELKLGADGKGEGQENRERACWRLHFRCATKNMG